MSWCGGGEISPTPGVEYRVLAIHGYTLLPASWPPSPGLGPLRHLDLQVVGVDQVLAGHAEPPAGDLLDRGPPQVTVGFRGEPVRILAALTGVRPGPQPVHRAGPGLVR